MVAILDVIVNIIGIPTWSFIHIENLHFDNGLDIQTWSKIMKHDKILILLINHIALITYLCPTRSGCKDKSVRLRLAYLHEDLVWVGRSHDVDTSFIQCGTRNIEGRLSLSYFLPSTMKKLVIEWLLSVSIYVAAVAWSCKHASKVLVQ